MAGPAVALALVAEFALSAAASAACLPADGEVARIAEVRDARTLALADGRLVRPAGIESFALIGEDADAADGLLAERLAALLAGRRARLHFVSAGHDRYGRRAALIAGEAGLVQAQLTAEGAAIAFPEGGDMDCMADILAAEATAHTRKAGHWAATAVKPAEPGAVSSHLGRYVIFEGEVLSVGNRTRRTYLDFSRRWSEGVTVVIEARDRDVFGGAEALARLAGRRVRVRGFVEERGGPMVMARWRAQIEVLVAPEEGGDGS